MKLLILGIAVLLVQQTLAKDGNLRSNKKHGVNSQLLNGKRPSFNSDYGIASKNHEIQRRLILPSFTCWSTCDSTVVGRNDDKLSFYYKKELFAIVNQTSYVALILDLKHQRGVLLDGYSGGGIVFSITEEEGFNVQTGFWYERRETFKNYFSSLDSLDKLWSFAHDKGTSFSIKNVSTLTLRKIHSLLIALSGKIAIETKHNYDLVFKILINISNQLVVKWGGSLKWILETGGSIEGAQFDGGLEILINISEGLREFFGHIKGGSKILIDANIKINLVRILKAKTGIHVIHYLLEQISDKVDLSLVLGEILSSKTSIFRVIRLLGGRVYTGVNGHLSVILRVTALLERTHPVLHKLAESLLRYSWTGRVYGWNEIDVVAESDLIIFKKQIEKYNNRQQLTNLTEIVQGVKDKRLIIRGVNVYLVTERLAAVGSINGIRLSVQILKIIKAEVNLNRSISILLLEIIHFLEDNVEAEILGKLIPSLKVEYNAKGEVNIVERIKIRIKQENIKLDTSDIYKLLTQLPVIKHLVIFIEEILKKEQVASLGVILKSSEAKSAVIGLANWIKLSLEVKVNIKGVTDIEGGNNSTGSGSGSDSGSGSGSGSGLFNGIISIGGGRRNSSSSTGSIVIGGGTGAGGGLGGSIGIGLGGSGAGGGIQIGGGQGIKIGYGGGIRLPFGFRSSKDKSHHADIKLKKHHKDAKVDVKKHHKKIEK